MKNYQVLTTKQMEKVAGGYTSKQCLKDIGKSALAGIGAGAIFGLATGGWTAAPGAFVGAHVGTIAGSLICIGGMLGN